MATTSLKTIVSGTATRLQGQRFSETGSSDWSPSTLRVLSYSLIPAAGTSKKGQALI